MILFVYMTARQNGHAFTKVRFTLYHELYAIQPVNPRTSNAEPRSLVEGVEPGDVLWLAAHGDLAALYP